MRRQVATFPDPERHGKKVLPPRRQGQHARQCQPLRSPRRPRSRAARPSARATFDRGATT